MSMWDDMDFWQEPDDRDLYEDEDYHILVHNGVVKETRKAVLFAGTPGKGFWIPKRALVEWDDKEVVVEPWIYLKEITLCQPQNNVRRVKASK